MSSIQSNRPPDENRYSSQQQQQGLTNKQQIQETKDEIEITALATFLQAANQTPGSDSKTSKKGKLLDIEKEMHEGGISPQDAANALLSIAQQASSISDLKLPPVDPTKIEEGKTSLLVHTEVFALFVNEHVKAKNLPTQLLNQTVLLANHIHNDSMPVRQGAESLTALVGQANKMLPLSQRYPDYRSDLFG